MTVIKPGISRDGDVWTIRVQVQRDGRTYDRKKQATGITLQAAQTMQAEMRIQLTAEIAGEAQTTRGTFAEYFDVWADHLVATGKARESTMKVRRVIANSLLIPYFGDRQLAKIKRSDIAAWQRWLSERRTESGAEYSQEYLRTGWRDLKALFSDARDLANLPSNPTAEMEFSCKGKDAKFKDALTLDETKAVLKAAEDENPDIACMIWVGITCGVRFGELTALTWADVGFDAGIIRINKSQVGGQVGKTKTSRNRIAPLHPDAKVKLLAHQEAQRASKVQNVANLVFPSNVGSYRYPSVLTEPLARCCERAGIAKHITSHSLRRTCNNLVRVSLGDVAARKMIGHVSASQTARYSVVEATELQQGQAAAFGKLDEGNQGQETQGQEGAKILGGVSWVAQTPQTVPVDSTAGAEKTGTGKG